MKMVLTCSKVMTGTTVHHNNIHIPQVPSVSDPDFLEVMAPQDSDCDLPHHRNHSENSMISPGRFLQHGLQYSMKVYGPGVD